MACPFTRAATPYWIIRVAPSGRVVKRSSAVLRLLARTRHYRRDAPSGCLCPRVQPLHNSLNPSNHPGWTTSSSRCEILGVKDGRLRIRTTAPPTDGRANKDVIRQLAKAFKIPPSRITLKRGATGRNKTFVIESLQGVPEWVEEAVTSPNISRVAAPMKENV